MKNNKDEVDALIDNLTKIIIVLILIVIFVFFIAPDLILNFIVNFAQGLGG